MKKYFLTLLTAAMVLPVLCDASAPLNAKPQELVISKQKLLDKIKGGWAGQTIGVTFGGPTEFKYNGTMIQDYIPIDWPDGHIKWYFDHFPGLFDDVYMDLTFVDVFEKKGIDAPVAEFANAFANAGYMLWHANQAARYNILNGVAPPQSGFWKNNPHADDIDFQIEADFAGLMSPAMPNAATAIADKIGHIMNYGDGWYGGVYVAAMYTYAFQYDDINKIVEEALKVIPAESKYYKCIADVIRWHKEYPQDWKRTWFEIEKKYSSDNSCPQGIFKPFNIDATINSAYVVLGLLYGQGDFRKTLEIATRAGQDSDCNPATAGGILGTMYGYDKIPAYWMKNLKEVEDMNFAYTEISLNKTYQMGFKHALEVIKRNGGSVDGDNVKIITQVPVPVRLEKSFPDIYPVKVENMRKTLDNLGSYSFEGTAVVVTGQVNSENQDYVADIEAYLDGKLVESFKMPANQSKRRHDIYWRYELTKGGHTISFKWLNPEKSVRISVGDIITFSDKPNELSY